MQIQFFTTLCLTILITVITSFLFILLRKIGQNLTSKPLRFVLSIFKDITFLISVFGIGFTIYLTITFTKFFSI